MPSSYTLFANIAQMDAMLMLLTISFLKMVAVANKGGQLITYSNRFTLSGMKGNFPPMVVTGLATVNDDKGPPTQDNTANPVGNPAEGDFGVAYAMQTGATRYAPMQPVPPTKITQKKHTPAYPTSAIQTIATTFLPIPKQKTTVTKVQTFSVSSRENPVCLRHFSTSQVYTRTDIASRPSLPPIPQTTWPNSLHDGRIEEL